MSHSMKDLVNKARSYAFEEEPEAQPSQQPATTPAPVIPITSAPIVAESSPAVSVPVNDDIYQRLAEQTNWEDVPVFQAIRKHLAPLDGMQIDAKTKFTIALKQAVAMDGIDPNAVTQTFETLKGTLDNKLNNFKQSVMNKTVTEVDAKKEKAEELQKEVQRLTEEAFAASARLQAAQHQFEVAAQKRLAEINQKQAEYTSLLS